MPGISWLWLNMVTKVTTKSYQGYYWTPKNAKNGPKQHNKPFFCPKGKKSLGRSPPQELEVSPRSGLYLLVRITDTMLREDHKYRYRVRCEIFHCYITWRHSLHWPSGALSNLAPAITHSWTEQWVTVIWCWTAAVPGGRYPDSHASPAPGP